LPEHIEAIAGSLDYGGHVESADEVRAPGMLKSHYAPRTPLELVTDGTLSARMQQLLAEGKTVCALAFQEGAAGLTGIIVAPAEPKRYAHELYRNLRKLDHCGADVILVEAVPDSDAWAGVADRLKRAAAR
jgi:L-threonylcarbamoyladenylate synthase